MLTYAQSCEWLFSRFPMYQKYGKTAFKPGLETISKLCEPFQSQLKSIQTIHLAGTNGKGSTGSMIASVLSHSGYKTGLFTSPHFLSFTERIQLDGQPISEQAVTNFVNQHKTYLENIEASFFEISLFLALSYFLNNGIECLILETGLGGRLDATNFIEQPSLTVLTNIGLDHQHILGNTLAKITEEKAGIMKAGVTCVLGEFHEETYPVFKKKAKELNLELIPTWDIKKHPKLKPQLKGKFQETNAHLAYLSCLQLIKNLPKLNEARILEGISQSQHYFFLPGRWQKLQEEPLLIFDMAHNLASLEVIKTELKQINFNKLHIIWAMAADKSVDSIFKELPQNAQYYLTPMNNPRSLSRTQLQDLGQNYLNQFECFDSPEKALNQSLSKAKKTDLILVAGSMFLLSELFSNFFSESLAELKKRSIFAPIKR